MFLTAFKEISEIILTLLLISGVTWGLFWVLGTNFKSKSRKGTDKNDN